MHIPTAISGNLKSYGEPWRVLLPGPKILFIGDNTEGKNRVLAGLTWAIGGFVSELFGKDVVQDAGLLMDLGRCDGQPEVLWSNVDVTDAAASSVGDRFLRYTSGSLGSAAEPTVVAPTWARGGNPFPLHTFLDRTVGRSATTTMKYLSALGSQWVKPDVLLAQIPKGRRDAFFTLVAGDAAGADKVDLGFDFTATAEEAAAPTELTPAMRGEQIFRAKPIETLARVDTLLRARRTDLGRKVKGGNAVLNEATPLPVTEEEVRAAADRVSRAQVEQSEWTATLEQLKARVVAETGVKWSALQADMMRPESERVFTPVRVEEAKEKLTARVAFLRQAAAEAAEAHAAAEAHWKQCTVRRETVRSMVDTLLREQPKTAPRLGATLTFIAEVQQADPPLTACAVCGTADMAAKIAQRRAQMEAKQAQQQAPGREAAQTLAELMTQELTAQAQMQATKAALDAARADWQAERLRLQRAEAMTTLLGELAALWALRADKEAEVHATTEAHLTLVRRLERWRAYEEARDNVAAWAVEHREADELIKLIGKMREQVVGDDRLRFVSAAQKYMTAGWEFDMQMHRGDRKDVRFGVLRTLPNTNTRVLHSALSGYETATVYGAVCAAITPVDSPISFNIPQDLRERDISPKHITGVMRALAPAPGCVYLFSTRGHSGRVPTGWVVVDLSDPATFTAPVVPIEIRRLQAELAGAHFEDGEDGEDASAEGDVAEETQLAPDGVLTFDFGS